MSSILINVTVLNNNGVSFALDPDPNTTAPSVGRITQSNTVNIVAPLDGQGIALQMWVLDSTLNVWFKLDNVIVCISHTINRLTKLTGATHFYQLVDNAGVTKIATYT